MIQYWFTLALLPVKFDDKDHNHFYSVLYATENIESVVLSLRR